MRDTGGVAK